MAPSTIRKAIGAVKDQTSISLAKVAGNIAPDLEVLVVKATTHDDEPADEKYLREIMNLISYSRNYVTACVAMVSKRLSKTRDWIVAVKALILVHRLMSDGTPVFGEVIFDSTRIGLRVLNMEDFREEAHSRSWDQAFFVRVYALYLEEKLEFEVSERRLWGREEKLKEEWGDSEESRNDYGARSRSYGDSGESSTTREREKKIPMREMKLERVLSNLHRLLNLLGRVLACRPVEYAKSSRLVRVALHQVVRESFELYAALCEAVSVLLDRFIEVDYGDAVKCFDAYVSTSKRISELLMYYSWCKEVGIARSSEFPEVQTIKDESLAIFEGILKDMKNGSTSPVRSEVQEKEVHEPDMNEIRALPAPENHTLPPPPPPPPPSQPVAQPQQPNPPPKPRVTDDLVNLRDDGVSAEEQGNAMALALFSGEETLRPDGSWEAFLSDGNMEVKSAWENLAAEIGKADWELALVETASNLLKQKADLGGGMDSLLLNGMYDQGAVNQHVSSGQLQSGSASSVALPSLEKTKSPMLALPAPDGTVKPVGPVDPFAASLTVPPPAYVQIADMEKKQHLLAREQQAWQQYMQDGMHGQLGLNKITGGSGFYGSTPQQAPVMPRPQPQPQPGPGGYYYGPTL